MTLVPRRFRVESFKPSTDKRAEPFGVDHAYSYIRSVLFSELFKMVCDGCWHVSCCHDCQRSSVFWKPTCTCLRLKDCLSKEGDQPIASTFRSRLDRNDILLLPNVYDEVCLQISVRPVPVNSPALFSKDFSENPF